MCKRAHDYCGTNDSSDLRYTQINLEFAQGIEDHHIESLAKYDFSPPEYAEASNSNIGTEYAAATWRGGSLRLRKVLFV
eukprot:205709-Pyramimonas_sp.AAC.1